MARNTQETLKGASSLSCKLSAFHEVLLRALEADGRVVTPEEMELSRLRAENLRLKRELEIIKKAAAYFAKDAL